MMRKVYAHKGQKKKSKRPFQYKGCGLDNVYLENGFTLHKTAYGDGYSIKDADALHEVIAITIALQPDVLIGQELAFLRRMLDLTQAEFAAKLGISRENYADWERARDEQKITKPTDRLVRYIFLTEKWAVPAIKELQQTLDHIDKNEAKDKFVFNRTDEKWHPPKMAA